MDTSKSTMIVLKADIDVRKPSQICKIEEYNGYDSLNRAVWGFIEYFHNQDMFIGKNAVNVDFICNEEFLYDENITKINALASIISGQLIYGDVAVVINNGDGSTKFSEESPSSKRSVGRGGIAILL